jgi:hypothetical protein
MRRREFSSSINVALDALTISIEAFSLAEVQRNLPAPRSGSEKESAASFRESRRAVTYNNPLQHIMFALKDGIRDISSRLELLPF